MRMKVPTSRVRFELGVAPYDLGWAVVVPPMALVVRDAALLSPERLGEMGLYWAASVACSLLAFIAFRIRDGLASYFSVQDALDVVKAAALAHLLLLLVIFTLTRLDGVPRSTPLIQALILATGLIAARALARISDARRNFARRPPDSTSEHIVMIGAGQLTALYLKLLGAYRPGKHRAIGILDERSTLIGRKLAGVTIIGTPDRLESLVREYSVHGIRTDRVLVGGDPDLLSQRTLKEIERVCAHWNMALEFIPRLMGLGDERNSPASLTLIAPIAPTADRLPRYLTFKPAFEFCAALVLAIVLSPFFVIAAGLVWIDVGRPLLFWQQRMGLRGRTFLLHKFRTLRAPFDWQGRSIAHEQRISTVGRFLRKTRLDELPQLLNVLVGEMTLIGPRPLLSEDQPRNVGVRLMVSPGITGWAQVNGGKLLTPEEKHLLDDWYIRNASPWVDVKILFATAAVVLFGERRAESLKQQNDQPSRTADLEQNNFVPAEWYKRVG